jgi:glycosyltransferase involved in cell wall biosynthesis
MLSVVIPSRSAQWLKKTVEGLFAHAEGEIEVIVVYDGRWPTAEELPTDDPRLIQIHHGELFNNLGMRESINQGMRIAKGDYVMKLDEQCAVDQGFDVKLAADCKKNWVVIPRRERLSAESWELVRDRRAPVDYMYLEYPYARPLDKTQGLHGALWKRPERDDILIDDTPTMQGSCYFMRKSYWEWLFPDGLDSENYGNFTQEAQEISMKVWLTGGRVVVNKKTWYAHWHKGHGGKGYGFNRAQYHRHCEGMEKGRLYCINHWLYTKDYGYDFDWFIKKFPTMPGWTPDWRERVEVDKLKDYSTLGYVNDEWLKGLRDDNKQ